MSLFKGIKIKGIFLGWVTDYVSTILGFFLIITSIGFYIGLTGLVLKKPLAEYLTCQITVKIIGLFCSFLGGYVSARVAKENEVKNALSMGVLSTLTMLALIIKYPKYAPVWHYIVSLTFIIPAALVGGYLAKRKNNIIKKIEVANISDNVINYKAVFVGFIIDFLGSIISYFFVILIAIIIATPRKIQVDKSLLENTYNLIFSLVFGLIFTSLGGYVTARMAKRREIIHSFLMGIVSLISAVIILVISPHSLTNWYIILSFLFTIPFALLGGCIRISEREMESNGVRKKVTGSGTES